MPKLLINDTVKYFMDRGNTAITKNFLYQGCRSGRLPHYKIGNRYILDTDTIEEFLSAEMERSIQQKEQVRYGKLRRVVE